MNQGGETPKRMTKSQRREQLLRAALAIVRSEGTDALTLGHLAERAGVSKPIAYEHFGTRSGLLIALCKQLDERQLALLLAALAEAPRRLRDVARVLCASYMACYTSTGPEWHALTGALQGDDEMNAYQREVIDAYVEVFRDALAPFAKLGPRDLRLRCVGVVGAAEALSKDMLAGRVDEKTAADTLTLLLVSTVLAKAC